MPPRRVRRARPVFRRWSDAEFQQKLNDIRRRKEELLELYREARVQLQVRAWEEGRDTPI